MAFAAISLVLDHLLLSDSRFRKMLTIDLRRSAGHGTLGNCPVLLDKNLRVRFSFTATSLAPIKRATAIHDVINDFEFALISGNTDWHTIFRPLISCRMILSTAMTTRFVDQRSALVSSSQPADPALSGKPLYPQTVKDQQAPVLVASFTTSAMPPDRISLAGMEKLLDPSAGGPIPSSVRKKDNNIFVRLSDPADLDRAKSILESKAGPDSVNIFNSVALP
jgi:hypothetical protein